MSGHNQDTRLETRAIHAGQEPDPATGAVIVPVYQTSTFAQPEPGKPLEHEYSRSSNPTRSALETCLASLEEGQVGLAFGSGLGALSTLMATFDPGAHVVCGDDLYGGTYRLFTKVFARYGLEFTAVDTTRPEAVQAAMRDNTALLWIETPSNPLLQVTDIAAMAKIAKASGALLGVDNTFLSPALQRPLTLGADVVMHSTTKYVGGHSDVVGGALIAADPGFGETLRFHQNAIGAVSGPWDSWLTLRGIKTLALRMRAHEANAAAVVQFLAAHERVTKVHYPGLPEHPGHAVQKRQADGFGGMVAFEVEGGLEAARKVSMTTRLFLLAESLGGVESLVEIPAIMTHASIPAEERRARGLADGLLRLSVGIEHPDDLIADLDRALAACQ